MDCLFALQSYINVLLLSTPQSANSNLNASSSLGGSSKGTDGTASSSSIKILLLDLKTTAILSLSTTQSNLLLHGVYLTDLISNPSRSSAPTTTNRSRGGPTSKLERLPHLHCITFLRPTEENIQLLERELNEARYGTYSLFFTGVLKRDWIERLAEADVAESVREVQEFYADFSPITPSHFTLSLLPTPPPSSATSNSAALSQSTTKTNPFAINPSPETISLYSEELTAAAESITAQFNRLSAASGFEMDGGGPKIDPNATTYQQHLQGLSAILLSLRKRPAIRFARSSKLCQTLGEDLKKFVVENKELFSFQSSSGRGSSTGAGNDCTVLILDRRNDPVTPLLGQWTYQAMVHELIGVENGRVWLGGNEVGGEKKEIVLSPSEDPFFSVNLYDNFGDLGSHLSSYVEEYSSRSAKSDVSKIDSVADMKRFIESYPEFRKLGGNVSKHVSLVGELSKLVDERKLLEVSELEQSLVCRDSHNGDLRSLQGLLISSTITDESKLRLGILYALRYQKFNGNNIPGIIDLLRREGVAGWEMVNKTLAFAGVQSRQDELFPPENFFTRGKSVLKGLKGVENVYTQHTPLLGETIEAQLRGRLKEASYPYVEGTGGSLGSSVNGRERPQDLIVFIVGGTTYEEAKLVASLNSQFASGHGLGPASNAGGGTAGNSNSNGVVGVGSRILLGGSCVHNSKSFLQMVSDATSIYSPPSSPTTTAAPLFATPLPAASASAAGSNPNNLNLNIGPMSLNIAGAGGAGDFLEAGVETARDGLRNLFGRVRNGVEL